MSANKWNLLPRIYISFVTHTYYINITLDLNLPNGCDIRVSQVADTLSESSRRQQWKTIQLPEELLDRVDDLVAISNLGYSSRAELVKEAVRLRVEDLERLLLKKSEIYPSK